MHAHVTDLQAERTRQFHAIYRREFAFVWACARRLGIAPAVIDDAVQEVFLTAYRRLDHLRYEVSPRASSSNCWPGSPRATARCSSWSSCSA